MFALKVFVLLLAISVSGAEVLTEVGRFGVHRTLKIQKNREYLVKYKSDSAHNSSRPYRIRTWAIGSSVNEPVLVVVRQERRVTSWEIPFLLQGSATLMENNNIYNNITYNNISRTLCYDTASVINQHQQAMPRSRQTLHLTGDFAISLSTAAVNIIPVTIFVDQVPNYLIDLGKEYRIRLSPSKPIHFVYDFHDMPPDVKTALLTIASDDDICFTASVQPRICPVKDLDANVRNYGEYQTISKKGGITISRDYYKDGFFIVFVAKSDDHDCAQENSLLPMPLPPAPYHRRTFERQTMINFTLNASKTEREYVTAILTVFFANLSICFIIIITALTFYWFGRYRRAELYIDEWPVEVDAHTLAEANHNRILKDKVNLVDFVLKGRQNNRKALNYFWHICNIAIFYVIPVVQLMVFYQRSVNSSGDLDLCYHNYQCAHPFYFTDFNHIYSNIGYVMFGILFLIITAFRNWKIHNYPNCGIPKFYGLFYAMGVALILEGVLSGCYHVCPTQANFQFDTSFMYMMALLIVAKLYQNRHPDINPSAYSTFFVLGIAVLLAMIGILFNQISVMIVFIISYITFCCYVSAKVYYFGDVLDGWMLIYNNIGGDGNWVEAMKPTRLGSFITLTIANVLNFAIAITGVALYPKFVDFGTFLLGILMLNVVLYTFFYITMKLVNKEKLCFETILYIILSALFWGFGGYFFLNATTLWSVTPAQSRTMNRDCIFMGFYDNHDIWHLLSAPALFFSFMLLSTLDDDLFDKPHKEIEVF